MKKLMVFLFSLLLCGSMAFVGCAGNTDSSSSSSASNGSTTNSAYGESSVVTGDSGSMNSSIVEENKESDQEKEEAVIQASKDFWSAMENADGAGMRAIADPGCTFVHIGMTCGLEREISFYTNGIFRPTEVIYNSRDVHLFADTAIVITDCNYTLMIGAMSTTHHFAVTEVFQKQEGGWKLLQFTFTALEY